MKNKVKEQSSADINPYNLDKLSKVPSWLIILLLKYWAAAAAVFFIVIGGLDIGFDFTTGDLEDFAAAMSVSFTIVILIALFLALFTNYIVRPIVRLMYNRRNNCFKYNMINMKGFKSFLVSLLYMFFMSFLLFFVTGFLSMHGWVLNPFGTSGGQGIEPFTYALFFVVFDAIFILIKNGIMAIYERIKYKKQIKGA